MPHTCETMIGGIYEDLAKHLTCINTIYRGKFDMHPIYWGPLMSSSIFHFEFEVVYVELGGEMGLG